MNTMSWDPALYQRYADERSRPLHDLLARVPTDHATNVVDLGCGPGPMTLTIARRWPHAQVLGIDSSVEMIDSARALAHPGRVEFRLTPIERWQPEAGSVDVIVSNAALQWVPAHMSLIPAWIEALRPGGTVAIQVPAVTGSPAADVFRMIGTSARWAPALASIATGTGPGAAASPVRPVAEYVELVARRGLRVDAWETTYLHILPGDDPVLEWYSGTGLRPYLNALEGDPAALGEFRDEVAAALRKAYPPAAYGTVLPFRRIFVVATRD
jgi:trans-aconitate 2-methyltransferase